MGREFVHLHTHSHFSLLAGLASPEELVQRAGQLEQPALALTDLNNMFGAVRFYRAAREVGVKPIFGLQLAVGAPGQLLTLLAETPAGYRNLLRLATAVRSEGSRSSAPSRPKRPASPFDRFVPLEFTLNSPPAAAGAAYTDDGWVDWATLFDWQEGLIVLSGGSNGVIARHVAGGRFDQAVRMAVALRNAFGSDRFFIELQHHGLPGQAQTRAALLTLAGRAGVGVVATNDVRYVQPSDAPTLDALLALRARTTLEDAGRPVLGARRFHLASADEMVHTFADVPEALANTAAIAQRCRVDLELGRLRLPAYDPAAGEPVHVLRHRAWAGARERFDPSGSGALPAAVTDRLGHELEIIGARGLASYFLIVADIVAEARRQSIRVGPGRGSAASSLVAYCLGITAVDPLAHGLVFERFLNPGRIGMPDIDVDVADTGRGRVLDYIRRRFGAERVAQIVTFGTLAARAALREAGRLLKTDRGDVEKVLEYMPSDPGMTLTQASGSSAPLRRLLTTKAEAARIFALAHALEGVPRHVSIHAAGVVIGDGPLEGDIPLIQTADGATVTQYAMDDVEALGFLKMDVLGLRTLSVVDDAWRWIGGAKRGGAPGPSAVDLTDGHVYETLRQQGTDGVFQLETPMFRHMTRRMPPERFEDIAALLALGRPGPMQRVDEFIRRRTGRSPVTFIHRALEPILAETYGVFLYQEQVMHAAMHVAGYSAAEADVLRRRLTDVGGGGAALGEEERARFVQSAVERGLAPAEATKILEALLQLGGYGFAKSHSVAYALLTFETAWLRTYYPAAFWAALLTSHMGRPDRVARYVAAARRTGTPVAGPDVNRSGVEFEPSEAGDGVSYGLAALRHVGRGAAQAIVHARAEGAFRSLEDLRGRLPARHSTTRVLTALVRAGACDGLGQSRAEMLRRLGAEGDPETGGPGPGVGRRRGGGFAPAGRVRQGALFAPQIASGTDPVSAGPASAGPVSEAPTLSTPTPPKTRSGPVPAVGASSPGSSRKRQVSDRINKLPASLLVRLVAPHLDVLRDLQRLFASHKGDVPVLVVLPTVDGRRVTIAVGRHLWVDDGPALQDALRRLADAGTVTVARRRP